MFKNSRYLTCGVDSAIPLELQLFLWNCVDELPAERDYLQVFIHKNPIAVAVNYDTVTAIGLNIHIYH